jgi:hypothetical protein
MMVFFVLILVSVAILFFVFLSAEEQDKPLALILLLSTSYYCIGGLWYWTAIVGGIFTGVHWENSYLLRSASILACSTAMLGVLIWGAAKLAKSHGYRVEFPALKAEKTKIGSLYYFLLAIGLIASFFILSKGTFSESRDPTLRGPLFLIAYQFADVLVAAILYRVATRGYDFQSIGLIAFFVIYGVLVGFRYKLALVGLPLLLSVAFSPASNMKKILIAGTAGACALALFSAMTIFRVKFGAPDLTRHVANPAQAIMYSIFAETNVLFGMTTIIEANVKVDHLFPFQPIIDTFKEYLPKAVFPNRETGNYLKPMRIGFLSNEGMKSGTAYPWIGEFCIMFGWAGMIVGPVLLGGFYLWLKRYMSELKSNQRALSMGMYILATIVGYYHFSRGYFPQISKSYIFVVFPYIVLALSTRIPAKWAARPPVRAFATPRIS